MSNNSSKGKGIGCLGWIGIVILAAFALLLFSYCWILAIPALIYCLASKKYSAYRKRNSLICVAVMIISFLTFGWLNSPQELNSISANWERTTYDVSETAEVEITPTPSDAEITSLSISDNDIAELDYENGKATITFNQAGSVSLFFVANEDIESNAVDITITDKVAEEEARKQAELEAQKKAEEEAKKQAELEAQKKAEEEAKKQAELEAQKKAEEEAKEEPKEETQTESQKEEPMVWIPSSGSKYHSNSSCSGMNNPTQIPKSDAESRGYDPCKKCY